MPGDSYSSVVFLGDLNAMYNMEVYEANSNIFSLTILELSLGNP